MQSGTLGQMGHICIGSVKCHYIIILYIIYNGENTTHTTMSQMSHLSHITYYEASLVH